ncbi:MAG: hypothetical protein H6R10_737 [Rhodocyclaceae bacterium]|nr:hypothetical protein [Rhodocyclaceae bacterium]
MEFCELEGAELDASVARVLGLAPNIERHPATREPICVIYPGAPIYGPLFCGEKGHGATRWAPSTNWAQGGPLIERFGIHLSGPESRVHRNGGPKAGWGESGLWTCTSWKLRRADGGRGLGYHKSSQLAAAMRLIAECVLPDNKV